MVASIQCSHMAFLQGVAQGLRPPPTCEATYSHLTSEGKQESWGSQGRDLEEAPFTLTPSGHSSNKEETAGLGTAGRVLLPLYIVDRLASIHYFHCAFDHRLLPPPPPPPPPP